MFIHSSLCLFLNFLPSFLLFVQFSLSYLILLSYHHLPLYSILRPTKVSMTTMTITRRISHQLELCSLSSLLIPQYSLLLTLLLFIYIYLSELNLFFRIYKLCFNQPLLLVFPCSIPRCHHSFHHTDECITFSSASLFNHFYHANGFSCSYSRQSLLLLLLYIFVFKYLFLFIFVIQCVLVIFT